MDRIHDRPPGSAQRSSHLAAPPLTRAAEPFEGAGILLEADDPTGVVLWKCARDVSLWASTPVGEHAALFARGEEDRRTAEIRNAEVAPELWAPLCVLARLLGEAATVDVARVVNACGAVSEWAGAHGRPAAALAFAQAAALAAPESARLAYRVGKLARERAEQGRAETWFRAAVKLGRGTDWEHYLWAYIGLGNLYIQVGNHPAAEVVLERVRRCARRLHRPVFAAMAHHALFIVGAERHDVPKAVHHAAAALAGYGASHPRTPALAHDVACFWTDRGEYRRALPVFKLLLDHIREPNDRAAALANTARAAAGIGDTEAFEHYAQAAEAEIRRCTTDTHLAGAYLNLSRGAGLSGAWEYAVAMASNASGIATRRGESALQFESEAAVDAARVGRIFASRAHPAGRPAPEKHVNRLRDALVEALTTGGPHTP